MMRENSPDLILPVDLNIRCSRKWAMPGGSPRIVRSAGAVPDHVGDDRHAMIGDHHDIHAVGELERAHLRLGASMASRQP